LSGILIIEAASVNLQDKVSWNFLPIILTDRSHLKHALPHELLLQKQDTSPAGDNAADGACMACIIPDPGTGLRPIQICSGNGMIKTMMHARAAIHSARDKLSDHREAGQSVNLARILIMSSE
jgi:hypothetical protein